jgi:Rieske Fe-S protein
MERRGLLRGLIWVAGAGVAASVLALVKLVVVPRKSAGYLPTVKEGDLLIYAEGSKKGQTIRLDDLQVGDSVLAYPKGKESNYANIIRVIREKPDLFHPPTRINWTDQGVVAYSAICTHLACIVSWEKASPARREGLRRSSSPTRSPDRSQSRHKGTPSNHEQLCRTRGTYFIALEDTINGSGH